MDKHWRGKKSFWRRIAAAGALAAAPGVWTGAATVILECASAVRHEGEVRLSFRPAPVGRLRPEKATLLLHVASGEAPAAVEIRKPRRVSLAAAAQEKGWLTVRLPAGLVSELLKKPETWLVVAEPAGVNFDLASHKETAPYLVVEGEAGGP